MKKAEVTLSRLEGVFASLRMPGDGRSRLKLVGHPIQLDFLVSEPDETVT
jgi:hypothetical protein